MNKKDFSLGFLSGVAISLSITYYLNKDLLIKSKKKKFKKRKKRKLSKIKTNNNEVNNDVKNVVNDVMNDVVENVVENVVNNQEIELDNNNLDIINKTDINRPASPNIKNELLKHINNYEKSFFGRLFRDY